MPGSTGSAPWHGGTGTRLRSMLSSACSEVEMAVEVRLLEARALSSRDRMLRRWEQETRSDLRPRDDRRDPVEEDQHPVFPGAEVPLRSLRQLSQLLDQQGSVSIFRERSSGREDTT